MRARAMAMSMALLLLAGTTAGVAAADQGGRLAEGPAARVASPPRRLRFAPSRQSACPSGPAQWYQPWLTGGAGSNYLGPGGWRSSPGLNYGPFGPYPTLQTAAFFGATNSPFDPFTTMQLTHYLALQNGTGLNSGSLSGLGPLASLPQTGLGTLANANINQLLALGVGNSSVNAQGQLTFTLGNGLNTFVVPQGQNFGTVTLGQIANQVPLVQFNNVSSLPAFSGLGGIGSFGTVLNTVSTTVTGP